MSEFNVVLGNALAKLKAMPEQSVHLCVTSPPYWGLRAYGSEPIVFSDGTVGHLGLEPTPKLFIAHMVEIFREVRRVLRNDGSLWLNMGDSHVSNPHGEGATFDPKYKNGRNRAEGLSANRGDPAAIGLKAKDLVMMPARLALALQEDGWYLRQQIPWLKRSAMPESTIDRPTSAVEYIFLFSKQEDYYYDREAVRIQASESSHARGQGVNPKAKIPGPNSRMRRDQDPYHQVASRVKSKQNRSFSAAVTGLATTRARRNTDWMFGSLEDYASDFQGMLVDADQDPVALVMNPQPFAIEMCAQCEAIYAQKEYRALAIEGTGAEAKRVCACGSKNWVSHFATFPERLVAPCIIAGTSEVGCCANCGAPYARVLEKQFYGDWHPNGSRSHDRLVPQRTDNMGRHDIKAVAKSRVEAKIEPDGCQFSQSRLAARTAAARGETGSHDHAFQPPKTLSWEPTCSHPLFPAGDPVPCTVVDPFSGSGRTGLAAVKLGRCYHGIELNPLYLKMSVWQYEHLTKGADDGDSVGRDQSAVRGEGDRGPEENQLNPCNVAG